MGALNGLATGWAGLYGDDSWVEFLSTERLSHPLPPPHPTPTAGCVPLTILYLTIKLLTALLGWQLRESCGRNYAENSSVKKKKCLAQLSFKRHSPGPWARRYAPLSYLPGFMTVWGWHDDTPKKGREKKKNERSPHADNFFWERLWVCQGDVNGGLKMVS